MRQNRNPSVRYQDDQLSNSSKYSDKNVKPTTDLTLDTTKLTEVSVNPCSSSVISSDITLEVKSKESSFQKSNSNEPVTRGLY